MKRIQILLILAVLAMSIVDTSSPAQAQTRSAGLMNFSRDGRYVACSNRDSGTVTISSGILTANGPLSANLVTLSGGTLAGGGDYVTLSGL